MELSEVAVRTEVVVVVVLELVSQRAAADRQSSVGHSSAVDSWERAVAAAVATVLEFAPTAIAAWIGGMPVAKVPPVVELEQVCKHFAEPVPVCKHFAGPVPVCMSVEEAVPVDLEPVYKQPAVAAVEWTQVCTLVVAEEQSVLVQECS